MGQEPAELPGTDRSRQQRGRGEDAAAPQAPRGASPRAGSPGKVERSREHKTQVGLSITEVEEENPKCPELRLQPGGEGPGMCAQRCSPAVLC